MAGISSFVAAIIDGGVGSAFLVQEPPPTSPKSKIRIWGKSYSSELFTKIVGDVRERSDGGQDAVNKNKPK